MNNNKLSFNTPESRKQIKQEYFVNGLRYSAVLGEMRSECLNRKLVDKYYSIELVKKDDKKIKSTHILGYVAAEDLLVKPLPFYDPFTDDTEASENGKNSYINNKSLLDKRTPLNKEAYRAVSLISSAKNVTHPYGIWRDILYFSQRDKDIEHNLIKKFNDTVKKYNTNIRNVCYELENNHNRKVKNPKFILMRKILLEKYNLPKEEILL